MRQADLAKTNPRNRSNIRLTTASSCRMNGAFNTAPAPNETPRAQMKSPTQAPIPTTQAGQKPPPFRDGNNPRRIISALTGPGGQETDQPRMRPFVSVDSMRDVKSLNR